MESVVGSKALKSPCRKVNTSYTDDVASNRVTKLSFTINVSDINLNDSPYWVIIYQDWVRIREDDANGNHPITTLKLKVFDGQLHLAHYDNSWQWGYDFGEDIWDSLHNHQENTLNGSKQMDLGVDYEVEIINYDSGRFVYKVNGLTISDKTYQTKSPDFNHSIP